MPHPDLDAERAHLHQAERALDAMAERTQAALADEMSAATEADAEVARHHLRRRLDSLRSSGHAVAFGRIDAGSGEAGPDRGRAHERWYVGRRHVEDDHGDPLVVDWRAPVAVPFYRATVHDPLGLRARRRFVTEATELVDILEEDFTDPDASLVSGGIPDPLLAELDRERTAVMRDIVATIAAEQDEIIRAPLEQLLVVQGGPGTGKTAVALHRAAYLLFEHRLRLLDRGVLVVGPNPVFLRYVADVLPSLGETAVRQTTIAALHPPRIRIGDLAEDPATVRVKGDRRMADVLDRLVRSTVKVPESGIVTHTQWGTIRLTVDDVAEAAGEILDRGVPHATGREALRNQLVHRAYELHERTAEVPALKANFAAAARASADFRAVIDRIWPTASAPALLARLYTNGPARREAAGGILGADEAELLARKLPARRSETVWSAADVALLDELEARISGPRPSYGHVIADEAQDLSDMELRMLARRAEAGSMTLVGDLAQGTRPGAQRSWTEVIDALAVPAPAATAELTVGYRTPAPILDLANRLLPTAAPGVTPARSIRATGDQPRVVRCAPDRLEEEAAAHVRSDGPGTRAVIAAARRHAALAQALDAAGIAFGRGAAGLGSVALLDPLLAKGLEFDEVVVVEPSEVVDGEEAGHRALFVALTRPTRRLTIVHAAALPDALAG